MRLHSIIIAYASVTPFAAISWDSKVQAFCEKVGCEDRCFQLGDDPSNIIKQLYAKGDQQRLRKEAETDINDNLREIIQLIG